jgi:tetratricopeptide (TPR) repeat protein
MRGARAIAAFAAGALWLVASVAFAQPTLEAATDEQRQLAIDTYVEGRARFEAGDYVAALELFERSQAAVISANTRLMYARCLAHLGRRAEAYDAYGEVAELAGSDPTKYQAATEAAGLEQDALRAQLARLTVEVLGEATSLTVGGRDIDPSRWGEPIAVDPGVVELVAVGAYGEQRQHVEIGVQEDQTVQVVIDDGTEHAASTELAGQAPPVEAPPAEERDDEANPAEARASAGLVIGAKAGGGLGKPFNEFGVSPVFELELGYLLPPLGRAIEIFVTGQYQQPAIEGGSTGEDARLLGAAPLEYEVRQQRVALSMGALYRIDLGSDAVMPYAGVGARMYMHRTTLEGSLAGERFADDEQTQTDFGVVALCGVDVFVGPGALLGEISFGWAKLDGAVVQDTNLAALSLTLGYRVML